MSPIIEALDLNHDGIIDADEIAKASESLKKLVPSRLKWVNRKGCGQLEAA